MRARLAHRNHLSLDVLGSLLRKRGYFEWSETRKNGPEPPLGHLNVSSRYSLFSGRYTITTSRLCRGCIRIFYGSSRRRPTATASSWYSRRCSSATAYSSGKIPAYFTANLYNLEAGRSTICRLVGAGGSSYSSVPPGC